MLSTEPYIKKTKPKGEKWTMSQANLQFCGGDMFLWCKIYSQLHSSYEYIHLGKRICYLKFKVLWKNEGMEIYLNNTSCIVLKIPFCIVFMLCNSSLKCVLFNDIILYHGTLHNLNVIGTLLISIPNMYMCILSAPNCTLHITYIPCMYVNIKYILTVYITLYNI